MGRVKYVEHDGTAHIIELAEGFSLMEVIWEEIMKRFPRIEVTGEPERVYSTFVRGYRMLPVRIPQRR